MCNGMAEVTETRTRSLLRPRTIRVALLAGVIVLGAVLSWGPGNAYLEANGRLAAEQREVAAMKKESQDLTKAIAKLRQPATVEMLARTEISYAHPGERVYVLMDPPAKVEGKADAAPPRDRGALEQLVVTLRGFF